jgi:hypothetical protein
MLLHYLLPLSPNKPRDSFSASAVKRNSLAGTEVLQIGVNLAANRVRGGSNSALDSAPLLYGQNATAHKVTGGSVLTSKGDFDPVREGLDRQRNIAVAFVLIRTRIHIPDRRVLGGHGPILLQNKKR